MSSFPRARDLWQPALLGARLNPDGSRPPFTEASAALDNASLRDRLMKAMARSVEEKIRQARSSASRRRTA